MKAIDCIQRILLIIFSLLLANVVYSQSESVPLSQADANRDRIWNDFREKYPYQFQMLGLAEYDDNSKLLIISEPPSHVSIEEIKRILNGYDFKLTIKQHPIGYDGWVKDLLLTISNTNNTPFSQTLKQLQKYLYHTDYKAYTIPLPISNKAENFLAYNTNLQISAAELQKWFLIDKEPLFSPNKQETDLNKCLNKSHAEGIYFSKKTGFVIWIVNILNDLKDSKIEARKFSLDADLILGAIARGKYVAIIGRERKIPVNLLPPLRVETIMRLAATEHPELFQSYERNNLFAGQLRDEKQNRRDWAPILLSEELWHTEYGQLLNITDQILKSWSENGNIEYENFNYEKPFEWAFDNPIRKQLEADELTYNWNTSGVGYNVHLNDREVIYALNRTGSLPVSYIPGQAEDHITKKNKVYQAEETAYNWFSNLNNPDLARVVQYAALYQIFQNQYIRYSGNEERAKHNLELLFPDNSIQLIKLPKSEIEKCINENPNLLADFSAYRTEKKYPAFKLPDIQKSFEITERIRQKHHINCTSLEKAAYTLFQRLADYDGTQRDSIENHYYKEQMFNHRFNLLFNPVNNAIEETKKAEYYQIMVPHLEKIPLIKLIEYTEQLATLGKTEYKIINKSLKPYFKINRIKKTTEKDKLITTAIEIFLLDKQYNLAENLYQETIRHEINHLPIFTQLAYLQKQFKSAQNTELSTGENLLEIIARYAVNQESITISKYTESEQIQIFEAINKYTDNIPHIQEYNKILNFYPLPALRNNYVNINQSNSSPWIKCPTIVQSWDTKEIFSVGGHNLSAQTTHYLIDKTIKTGTYNVKLENGKKFVYLGKADIHKITPELLREIERTHLTGTNHFSKIPTKILSRNEVIPAVIPQNQTQRGFIAEDHVLIKQTPSGFEIVKDNEKTVLSTYEQVNYYLAEKNQSAKIIFEDYTANEVKATINSADIRQTAYLKKTTNFPTFQIDYANASYTIISDNQIEVILPYVAKKASHTKISFKNTTIEKVKSFLNKLGQDTKKNAIYKEVDIRQNNVKKTIILEFENGIISDNYYQHEQSNERIGLSADAA